METFALKSKLVKVDSNATDYIKEMITISSNDKINIHLAPGGG